SEEKHAKTCSRRCSGRCYFRGNDGTRRSPLAWWLAPRLGRTRYRIRAGSRRLGPWSHRRLGFPILLRARLLLRAAILPTWPVRLLWRSRLLRTPVLSLGSTSLLVKKQARMNRVFFLWWAERSGGLCERLGGLKGLARHRACNRSPAGSSSK